MNLIFKPSKSLMKEVKIWLIIDLYLLIMHPHYFIALKYIFSYFQLTVKALFRRQNYDV